MNRGGRRALLLGAAFLTGAVLGVLYGRVSPELGLDLSGIFSAQEQPLPQLVLSTALYHILVCFAGTSVLGSWLIPLLFAVRGFALCLSALVLASAENGALPALITLGLPALFTIPSLFVLGEQCLAASLRLRALSVHRTAAEAPRLRPAILISFLALCAAIAARAVLIPAIIELII